MAKIYSRKSVVKHAMKPTDETVNFLLSYSKALSIIKIDNVNVEIISN
jgi:hypothetical protein